MATAAVYLEQYLDSLDSLPEEMREKFDRIRQLDHKVMDEHKRAESKKLALFKDLKSGRKMEDKEKKRRITEIQALYRECNSISDQKCQLASQAYEMIDKHIRKLDTELARFETELKQQQMEQLNPSSTAVTHTRGDAHGSRANKNSGHNSANKTSTSGGQSADTGKRKRKNESSSAESSANKNSNINSGSGLEILSAAGGAGGGANSGAAILGLPDLIGGTVDVLDMPVDPNEPTYCLCQQVSYGEMIGCDNPDCPIEWFHFNCVGLSAKPKGKWFCSRCSAERKKKLTAVVQ
ncbi:inhibitor of growth protein 4-like isoform X2 [Symsagittifera roscoffensis]|uniref:inhibitor of growth protein 4-like isoform X2 n=1 Tax=Symsagittifera roscoffensis TaxID=84072 RepID=UPI00307B2B4D